MKIGLIIFLLCFTISSLVKTWVISKLQDRVEELEEFVLMSQSIIFADLKRLERK